MRLNLHSKIKDLIGILHTNRYACLVAEPNSEDSHLEQEVVGVVDVTVMRDQNVVELLPSDAKEYLYVSGIAVLNNFRFYFILMGIDLISIFNSGPCYFIFSTGFWLVLKNECGFFNEQKEENSNRVAKSL